MPSKRNEPKEPELQVVYQFIEGDWTYRPGERFTASELDDRGMDEAAIDRQKRRGALADPEDVPEPPPAKEPEEAVEQGDNPQ